MGTETGCSSAMRFKYRMTLPPAGPAISAAQRKLVCRPDEYGLSSIRNIYYGYAGFPAHPNRSMEKPDL